MSTRDRRTARRRPAPRILALALVVTVGFSLISATSAAAKPKPPNPSDQQLKNARAAKVSAANGVGRIAGRLAVAQSQLDRLKSDSQVAEQKLALARQRQQDAEDGARKARGAVQHAQAKVDRAHRRFVIYLQATYMSGRTDGTLGGLLTAQDPTDVLEQGAVEQYVAAHQLDAIGQLSAATVAKSNADAAARAAAERQSRAAEAARIAQQDVLAALSQAKTQQAALEQQMASDRRQLRIAQMKLTGLIDQRAAYRAWKKQQERIAAREAARKRRQQLAQQRAAAAASAPRGGSWSAARGQLAVRRVMGYVGMPYSWAAGNASGPTYGVSEPGAAWNDSHIIGFDCSGLTIYAWAPWRSMAHYAAAQYTQAGNYHPSIDQLRPGDLVFWSGDGTISGIGHEAMYLGGGNVIQAPQSGDVIKISNIYNVESGYFGATRPLT